MAIEDGYVSVPVIEAVEVVVTEMKRQQQPVDPAFCRCNHWFAGDSVEAAFIRQHGQCQDCVEMDQMLEREVQAENAKRYLWLRNTALYASDLAREVNRMDKSVVNLFPRARTATSWQRLIWTRPSMLPWRSRRKAVTHEHHPQGPCPQPAPTRRYHPGDERPDSGSG
ncbi:hypothetical protein P4133_10870 [Pseudomonas aeruginosa]|nr:hypothetical protein [Pseudomonas aeruginosa]